MKRRLLLAQALLGNPQILILDEPTAGLDPSERISMRNLLARIGQNRIVLLATHIASDIESIANKVILLQKGQILAIESPAKLKEMVQPYIKEIFCTQETIALLEEQKLACNYVQTSKGLCLHMVSETIVTETVDHITLEDVYLFYFSKTKHENLES